MRPELQSPASLYKWKVAYMWKYICLRRFRWKNKIEKAPSTAWLRLDIGLINPQPSTSNKVQEMPSMNMYMPYIEGPSMDWIVNDNLYNRFLKWKLKCKKILECELAMLPEARKCKKIVAWSGDFGLDQYISWNFPKEDLTLEVIWKIWRVLQTTGKWIEGKIWFTNKL